MQVRFVPGVSLVETKVLQLLTSVGKKIHYYIHGTYLTLDDVRNEGNNL